MKINNKGFSLVELLTVIAIIGILSGLAITAVTAYLNNARDQVFDSFFEMMEEGTKQYMLENNFYPSSYTFTAKDLLDHGHINEMVDPRNDTEECYYDKSIVKVTASTGSGLKDYNYEVTISCPTKTETRP